MTTYQLADFFCNLRDLLGEGLKADAKTALTGIAEALRDRPDQSLKDLTKQLTAPAGQAGSKTSKKASIDVPNLISRIREVRERSLSADEVTAEITSLTNPQLKEVLKAFETKSTTKVADNRDRVLQLLADTENSAQTLPVANGPQPSPQPVESKLVDDGVELYRTLWNADDISIEEVRSRFAPVLDYSKPVLEEITRRLNNTPFGTREELGKRLLTNLETYKVSQFRGELIMSGQG